MIENKLLHFRTRKAFEDALHQIGQNSVAFVDEGKTIYTHGVEYNCDQVRSYVDQIYNEIDSQITTINSHLENLINELDQYVKDTVDLNVQDTIDRIKDAEDLINEVKERLNGLSGDLQNWGIDINDLKTKVAAFTTWYDTTQQTLTNLSATVNRVDGAVSGFGLIVDAINNTVNTFTANINTKIGQLEYSLEHLNIDDDVRTIIGREISAEDGLLHDFVKTTDIDIDGENITSVIEQWFETYDLSGSNNPSWNSLVTRVSNNESALATIRQKVGNDYAALTGLSQWKTDVTTSISALRQEVATGVASEEVDAIVENYINNSSALAQLRTWATNLNSNTQSGFSLSAIIKSLTNANGDSISDQELSAAYIEGINNNNNTSIKIHANQIQLDGNTIFDILSGTSAEYNDVRAYTDIYKNGRAVFADLDSNNRVSILPSGNKALIVLGNSRFDGDIEASYITCRHDFNATGIYGKGLYITTDDNGTVNQQVISADGNGVNLNLSTMINDTLYVGGNSSFDAGVDIQGNLDVTGGDITMDAGTLYVETGKIRVGESNDIYVDIEPLGIRMIRANDGQPESLLSATSAGIYLNNTTTANEDFILKGQLKVQTTVNEELTIVNGITQNVTFATNEIPLWLSKCDFDSTDSGLSDPGHIYGTNVFKLRTYESSLVSPDNYLLEYYGTDTTFRYCLVEDTSSSVTGEDYTAKAVVSDATLSDIKSAMFVNNDTTYPYIFVWLDNKKATDETFFFKKVDFVTLQFINGICTGVQRTNSRI